MKRGESVRVALRFLTNIRAPSNLRTGYKLNFTTNNSIECVSLVWRLDLSTSFTLAVERRPLNASEFYDDAQMFAVVVALFKFNYRGVR